MIVVRDTILTLPARDIDQYMANRETKSNTLLKSSRPQDGGLISYKIIWHICFYFKAFGNKVRITILEGFMCFFVCLERSPLEGMRFMCYVFCLHLERF